METFLGGCIKQLISVMPRQRDLVQEKLVRLRVPMQTCDKRDTFA